MPTPRLNATELARLLNSASEPIYVLDDDLTVVFFNRACREWLGEVAEGLLGHRCAYHSTPAVDGADAVAAGLCPPPQVLTGQTAVATVSYRTSDGSVIERWARFLPFTPGGGSVLGVIAMMEAAGAPAPEPTPSEALPSTSPLDAATPAVLHMQIARFRQEAASRYRADRLIGDGPAMRLARRQVELAVGSHSSVVLAGPPGSGRHHLAAAIHYGMSWPASSSLLSGGLIPLDCSALGADLLDGLITALAKIDALGKSAGSCTLLLSRVDELSADVQTELALMLARRALPVRLIATAAAPLLELARRGMFRDDLAAMLSTIVIELPPLAQRRNDLPLLVQLFLEEANAAGTRQIGGFAAAAMDVLDAYSWPGNLDELAKVVAQSHRCATSPQIDVNDLPEKLRRAAEAAAHPRRADETIVLDEYLARVERELIRRALVRAKGNKAQAARLLGLTRPRLYRRMVQLGVE